MNNSRYPLQLEGITVPLIWGGHKLNTRYGKGNSADMIGESWELTVRPGRNSLIVNGDFSGQTLDSYIRIAGNDVVSDRYNGGRFPLLVKLIDASDRLSVQVHPDDVYAARAENDSGKTEMWYVIDAVPGARLVYGLEPGKTARELEQALRSGAPMDVLHQVEVHPGDVFFIPSGMVHSIGAGILVAEIQQNSDLTYRVYDYGRLGNDGKPRTLHTEKALDVIHPFSDDDIAAIRYATRPPEPELLSGCPFFTVYMRHITEARGFTATARSFHCLMCVGGAATLSMNGISYGIVAGQCWFIPANCGEYLLCGNAEVLQISL